MKKKLLLLFLLCSLNLVYAVEDCLYFGGNFENSTFFKENNVLNSQSIGVHLSTLTKDEWGKFYAKIGCSFDVSNNKNYIDHIDDLKSIVAMSNIDSKIVKIPIRIGYPFDLSISENTKILLLPAASFDFLFGSTSFSTNVLNYEINCKVKIFNYDMGFSFDAAMQHQFSRIFLRYGIDFNVPILGRRIYDVKCSTALFSGKVSDSEVITIADYFTLELQPYISIGFKLS